MNTPSHFLMTIVAGKFSRVRPPRLALAIGSVAPDIPLYFLSFGAAYFYTQVEGWPVKQTFRHIFGYLFYQHPGWIVPHNFLHAPIWVGLLWGLAWCGARAKVRCCRWICWFLAACMVHSLVDVVTHHDDGPLLFFPFNWQYRFASPVSYWDPEHYGTVFSVFEVVLDVVLIALLVLWRKHNPAQNQPE